MLTLCLLYGQSAISRVRAGLPLQVDDHLLQVLVD